MGLARSTFYDAVPVPLGADELVARIVVICDAFECYGYRRVEAALRHQGVVVNRKKLRRLMREHGLQPKGCIHHSDRGSQYASEEYRELLAAHGLKGSMSRPGNPYDNAKAESFMTEGRGRLFCRP